MKRIEESKLAQRELSAGIHVVKLNPITFRHQFERFLHEPNLMLQTIAAENELV